MKRVFFSFFLLLTAAIGRAQTFYVDNIRYKVTSADELTVAVIGLRSDYDVTSIVIPENVTVGSKTYSVTAIDNYAIQDCKTLTSVSIGNNVRTIGYQTFAFCYNLTSVNIGNSVAMIDELAFRDCRNLTSVTIPNSMTTIIGSAFAGCCSLTSVTIPNSVTMLDGNAFPGCSGLEHIVVEAGNPVYDSRNNSNAIIETASNSLISGCKNTVIPNSVTKIACCAFDGCISMTSVTIPNSVTEIEDWAFFDCSGLKDVYCFARNVPITDVEAFYRVNLSSLTLHVPATSLQDYGMIEPWSDFGQIVAISEGDGIEQVNSKEENPTVSYDLSGRRTAKTQKGINLLRDANGHVKKVLRK